VTDSLADVQARAMERTGRAAAREIPRDHPREIASEHRREDRMDAEFACVFESEFDYVWNSLRRLGVREADLDDQVHELFLRVHRRWDRRDPARPVRPWLLAFAARVAADYRKLAYCRREIPGLSPHASDPAPLADAAAYQAELRAIVLDALQRLPWDRRALFIAVEIDGQSGPEVAEALGIPLNTAYSRLRVARTEFASALHELRGSHKDPP
jgi:RNA polymerase sigma-70 factor (ECF subfamily)